MSRELRSKAGTEASETAHKEALGRASRKPLTNMLLAAA